MKTKLGLLAMLALAGCGAAVGASPADDVARLRAHCGVADRGEYLYDAQQEHDRASLMMILTASRPR